MNITDLDVADALGELNARQKRYHRYHEYYEGDQRLAFATDSFRNAFGVLFKEFAYNRCKPVVTAFADRLQITGWETDGKQDKTVMPVEKAALAIWTRNRMQKRQGELHKAALRDGDAYLIVWPDIETGLSRFHINPGKLINAVYDDETGEIVHAVKVWQEERGADRGKWRVTVYEPDTITRFITKSKRDERPKKVTELVPYTEDEQPEADNPYGRVPVFHFANDGDTADDGMSELADVIPLQDALNKMVLDMVVAAEYQAYQQRWVTGVDPEIDPATGKPIPPFDLGKDRLLLASDAAANFGAFPPVGMDQFISMQDSFDMKISRVSGVPVHWLNQTGNFPSGESLKTAEGPFVSKVKDRQTVYGGEWAEVMGFALAIDGQASDTERVNPLWAPAESRSDLEFWQLAALKKAAGVPQEQIWAEAGYSPDEILEFTAAAEKKQAEAAQQFGTAFNRGQTA